MISLAMKGMVERKLRSALTAVAIVLGVAMVAGTFVQTDRIRYAFDEITSTARKSTDVVITRPEAFTTDLRGNEGLSERYVDVVRKVPGVAKAEGQLSESGSLVVNGETTGSGFARSIVISTAGEPFTPLQFTEGRLPQRSGEVAVTTQFAEDEGLTVGQRVGLTTRTGVQPVTISGIADYGDATSLGGTTLTVGVLADLQRWYSRSGEISEIVVAARDGVTDTELARRITAALPKELLVETGAQNAKEDSDEINKAIGGFLTPALLALAGAALLVGGFIIFNTFSITVAQRTREFGLLRALGATRRQILGAVVVEALVLGIAASVLGILGGLGFAVVLGWLLDSVGFGIPAAGIELAPRTIALSLGVGIGVTVIAAIAPARRATRVQPVAALSAMATVDGDSRRGFVARVAPVVVGLLGMALLAQGLFGAGGASARLGTLAAGAVLVFVAVALVARYLVRPLASAIGWPLERVLDEPGRLARDNAMRNPARTAATSAALMVGLGLVVFVAVFAAGLKSSISGAVDDFVKADFIVTGKGFQPMPLGAGSAVAKVDGVGAVSPQYADQVQVNGRAVSRTIDQMNGMDPIALPAVYDAEWLGGGSDALLIKLRGATAAIEEQFAKRHSLTVGERFEVATTAGKKATLTVIGTYRDPIILQGMIVSASTFRGLSALRDPFAFYAGMDASVDREQVQRRIEAALSRYPATETRTTADYQKVIEQQVNAVVYLLYALLAMSLVISLFGIANSLFLSIYERVREFGLLRAIGTTQAQVRRVVRYESVITSIIGGTLGTVIGVAFAAITMSALGDLGLRFALPVGQLGLFVVLAIGVGMWGAVIPARRAAAVDVLEAMRHD